MNDENNQDEEEELRKYFYFISNNNYSFSLKKLNSIFPLTEVNVLREEEIPYTKPNIMITIKKNNFLKLTNFNDLFSKDQKYLYTLNSDFEFIVSRLIIHNNRELKHADLVSSDNGDLVRSPARFYCYSYK
jgi:hypothetical protein